VKGIMDSASRLIDTSNLSSFLFDLSKQLQDLISKVAKLEREASQKKDIPEFTSLEIRLNSKIRDLEVKCEAIEEKVNLTNKRFEGIQTELADSRMDLNNLRRTGDRLDKLEYNCTSLIEQRFGTLAEKISNYENKFDYIASQLSSFSGEIAGYEEQANLLKRDKEELTKGLLLEKERMDNLSAQLSYKIETKDLDGLLSDIDERLADYGNKISQIKKTLQGKKLEKWSQSLVEKVDTSLMVSFEKEILEMLGEDDGTSLGRSQ
jgi:chromosome segregation ATPase